MSDELSNLRAITRRVSALHRPHEIFAWGRYVNACSHCQRGDGWPVLWPCETAEALEPQS